MKDLNSIDLYKIHMTQIKINCNYEILLLLLKKERHQREFAKELKTSLTRVQSSLKELRDLNVIDYKQEGKNYVYFIKKNWRGRKSGSYFSSKSAGCHHKLPTRKRKSRGNIDKLI